MATPAAASSSTDRRSPRETARRLSCDASVVRILEDSKGEPLDVGRKTRTIPPAIRRALNARDKGCRFPGCSFKRYVDGHHVHHWANGGETRLSNLVTLCRFHHRLVHEGQVEIQVLDDGVSIPTREPGGETSKVRRPHRRTGASLSPRTRLRIFRSRGRLRSHAGPAKRSTSTWRSGG